MEVSTASTTRTGGAPTASLVIHASVLVLALWMTQQGDYVGFYWDDAFYLRMADLLSPWWQGQKAEVLGMVRERGYPLLYPALLGVSGAGFQHLTWTYAVNGLLIGAGWLLVWHWARQVFASRWAAVLITLLAVINLQTLQLLNVLLSEHLYVVLSFGCFVAWRRRDTRSWLPFVAAVLAGMTAATRGIGIALPIALSLVLLSERRPHRLALLALTWTPLLAERLVWNSLGLPSYASSLAGSMPGPSGGEWAAFMHKQFGFLWAAWSEAFSPTPLLAACWLLPCAILAPVGLLRQWRRGELEALYLTGYLAITLLWPFATQMARFLHPVLPLVTLAAVAALTALPWRSGDVSQRATATFLGFGAAAICLPTLLLAITALFAPLPATLEPLRRTPEWMGNPNRDEAREVITARRGWLDDMDAVESGVPADDCVYSELFAVVMARTTKVVALPPWRSVGEAPHAISGGCGYYYFVPLMLNGGNNVAAVDSLVSHHTMIHRSASPRDPSGRESLGILLRLTQAPAP